MATMDSTAEIGKLIRRKRMKSKLVLSGTMRRRRTVLVPSGLVKRFHSNNHIDFILQPRPEERALARVSKDGHRRDPCPRPSFETAALRARPPQDEVLGSSFDR